MESSAIHAAFLLAETHLAATNNCKLKQQNRLQASGTKSAEAEALLVGLEARRRSCIDALVHVYADAGATPPATLIFADSAEMQSRLAELAARAEVLVEATRERRSELKDLQSPSVETVAAQLARDLAALRDDLKHFAKLDV